MREKIGPRCELRFVTSKQQLPASDSGRRRDILRVISGTCEVFGAELFPGMDYPLVTGRSYGIFSWGGCELELDDSFCENPYVSEEAGPMIELTKVAWNVEKLRIKASQESKHGPRVAIVGPKGCGKSTYAKTLVGYAVRTGGEPILVDLDIGKNGLSVPGCIASTVVKSRAELFEETGDVGSHVSPAQPLSYFVGAELVTDNAKRLKEVSKLLGENLKKRMESDDVVRRTGMVIDSFSWTSSSTVTQTMVNVLKNLGVNVVVVVGDERLLAQLKREFKDSATVVKVSRSGGVISDETTMSIKKLAAERWRWYFEGSNGYLSPLSSIVQVGTDVRIVLARANVIADDSIRPIGMDVSKEDEEVPQIKTVDPSLRNAVFAVVYASSEEEALKGNAAGFVYVTDVDIEENKLSICTPCPGDLKSAFLVHGKVKMAETL